MLCELDGLCLLGDCNYKWDAVQDKEEDTILAHLLTAHKIVIASIHTVYDVNKYCKYWRNKINSENLIEHLHGINVHPKDNNDVTSELYFMLNDTSVEDRNIRRTIYLDKLNSVLKQQQKERECLHINIQCLFCPETLKGDRFNLSDHLYEAHSFTLGHPDNLVYTVKFIEHLRSKMGRFECLYCDKTFRDYKKLREHMRKKLHKKLNPRNAEFDRYYLINYREFGKTWKHLNNEINDIDIRPSSKNGSVSSLEEAWGDWEDASPQIKCLACEVVYTKFSDVKDHMISQHNLDLELLTNNMSYYKQIKLVNYIRYNIADSVCPFCLVAGVQDMLQHLHTHPNTLTHQHYNDDRYLFPALDDDYVLCCLKDEPEDEGGDAPNIIPEDIPCRLSCHDTMS